MESFLGSRQTPEVAGGAQESPASLAASVCRRPAPRRFERTSHTAPCHEGRAREPKTPCRRNRDAGAVPHCSSLRHSGLRLQATERLLLNQQRCRDSWPPEENNSIRGRGLITQSFCMIKFYLSIKEIENTSDRHQRGRESAPC